MGIVPSPNSTYKLYLEPEGVTGLSRPEKDEGYIGIPPIVYSRDIILEKKKSGEQLSHDIEQYLNKYNFYYATFNIGSGIDIAAKGAKWILIKGTLTTGANNVISVDDVGPKTKWSEGNKGIDVSIKVDFNKLSSLFEFLSVPNINPIEGSLNIKYSKNPKIAEIVSVGSGINLEWKFTAAKDEYADGNHQVFFIFRASKNVKNVFLDVYEAMSEYDYSFATDILRYKGEPYRVTVEIPEVVSDG